MATAAATANRQRRAPAHSEPEPAEVLGSTLLPDGSPAWLVSSASDPSRPRIVREVGPDGWLACGMPGQPGCEAAQHGRKCRHVVAVVREILDAEMRQCEARRVATAEALARVRASLDAADERQRRDTSSTRPRNDAAVPFSVFKR